MRIEEIVKHNDIDTYRALKESPEKKIQKPKGIKLGDSVKI